MPKYMAHRKDDTRNINTGHDGAGAPGRQRLGGTRNAVVGSLQRLPSQACLLVPRRRILWPFPPSSAFTAPADGFPVDSRRRQRSIALNLIPPLPISQGLDYPLGSRMHLVVVHPRLDTRGRPFPRSPRSCSRVNLRVLRPLTPGPQRQPSPLQTPHGHPGVQGIFLTSRGQVFHS